MVDVKITSVHRGTGQKFTVAPAGEILDAWNSAAMDYTRVNVGKITTLTASKDMVIVKGVTQEIE